MRNKAARLYLVELIQIITRVSTHMFQLLRKAIWQVTHNATLVIIFFNMLYDSMFLFFLRNYFPFRLQIEIVDVLINGKTTGIHDLWTYLVNNIVEWFFILENGNYSLLITGLALVIDKSYKMYTFFGIMCCQVLDNCWFWNLFVSWPNSMKRNSF